MGILWSRSLAFQKGALWSILVPFNLKTLLGVENLKLTDKPLAIETGKEKTNPDPFRAHENLEATASIEIPLKTVDGNLKETLKSEARRITKTSLLRAIKEAEINSKQLQLSLKVKDVGQSFEMTITETILLQMLCGRTQCWKTITLASFMNDSTIAHACLAIAYAGGTTLVTKDMTNATTFANLSLPWLICQKDTDDPLILVLTGLFHQYGIGFIRSYTEAAKWFYQARRNGLALYCAGMLALSTDFPDKYPDYVEAFQCLSDAAALGIDNAQRELGRAYETGRGTGRSFQEALKWYQRATENGIKEAATDAERCESKLKPCSSPEATAHNFVRLFTQVLCQQQTAWEQLQIVAIKDKNPVAQACMSILLNSRFGFLHLGTNRVASDDEISLMLAQASLPWLQQEALKGCTVASTFLE